MMVSPNNRVIGERKVERLERKAVLEIILAFFLMNMLVLALEIRVVTTSHAALFSYNEYLAQHVESTLIPTEPEPMYVEMAEYYDNRKCVVTSTLDDISRNSSAFQHCLAMLTEKKIYHTVGIVTNQCGTDNGWGFVQYWLDQGYTEAGSHSRNHVHTPYTGIDPFNGKSAVGYEWQIEGSKNDITGNLTLPNWWRFGDREYVYAWIEPYGFSDDAARLWLGDTYYLIDRTVDPYIFDFALWDSGNDLFNRIGYTYEMGVTSWGGTSVSYLNSMFDHAYNNCKIYHLMTHPINVDWSEGAYSDQHTDYISNREDVWYVPFGLLYLYHCVEARNMTKVASMGSGQNKIFKISTTESDHFNYGISYPITYVFDIPSGWVNGHVNYRYVDKDPWMLMSKKSPEDFFNGIDAVRFDFTNNKAYFSVGFSNVSHDIYVQLYGSERIEVPNDYLTIQEAVNHAEDGDMIYVKAGIYYENVVVNGTIRLLGESKDTTIIDGNGAGNVVLLKGADGVTVTGFTIRNGSIGVSVRGFGHTVVENLILGNTYAGLDLVGRGNFIRRNMMINNRSGINLCEDCEDNYIGENTLIDNMMGISITGNNNRVVGNTIKENMYGIKVAGTENTICHNDFLKNTNQTILENSLPNSWDDGYPSGGNYWSDYGNRYPHSADEYNGEDQDILGRDGIWDHPYYIDSSHKDNYPLVEPCVRAVATIDIDPDTLSISSLFGKWVTAHIELPEGYNVSNVDISTVKLNNEVQAELHPTKIGDYDNDGIPDLTVKFDRANVVRLILRKSESTLSITGTLIRSSFEGSETIRVHW